MKQIHVLTTRTTPNSAAFNLPLSLHKGLLREHELDVTLSVDVTDKLLTSDVLLINSKYFRRHWSQQREEIFDFLDKAGSNVGRVLWFDTTDSTGTTQFQVLPYVHGYYKAQILGDRHGYLEQYYGHRVFTDYYHRRYGILDHDAGDGYTQASEEDLGKIRVSWNSSLGDYGHGLRYEVYSRVREHLRIPLWYSVAFTPPRKARQVDISCRVGLGHSRNTVRYQRQRLVESLKKSYRVPTENVSKNKFWRELQNAKVVASPFGWGEITLRDFQVFINGAALLKPDMSHVETWPPLYAAGQTYVAHSWDMTDLEEKLDHLLSTRSYTEIAENAQSVYKKYLLERDGHLEFCRRLADMVADSS